MLWRLWIARGTRGAIAPLVIASQSTGSFDTSDLIVRPYAAFALWQIDREAQSWVIPILIEALNEGYLDPRLTAVRALGQIGPHAKGAIPMLLNARKAPDQDLRSTIDAALDKIVPKPKAKRK